MSFSLGYSLPALRRGCRKLIISDANGDKPAEEVFGFDIKSYFGRAEEDYEIQNLDAKVFEEAAWDALRDDITAKAKAGETCVHAATLRVLPNERAGVAGGYDVDTVWIINSKQKAWFDALPAESQKLLNDADATEQKMLLGQFPISNHLKDLPYTSTFEMSPDAQLVGYLSQHTTHAILQAKPEIDALMAK